MNQFEATVNLMTAISKSSHDLLELSRALYLVGNEQLGDRLYRIVENLENARTLFNRATHEGGGLTPASEP